MGEIMSWICLLLIDIIYVLQFIIFIQWYYPKVIIISGCCPPSMFYESLIGIAELVTCYILSMYNVKKLSME